MDATYDYVILPNKSKADTNSYALNPDIVILQNSKLIHAVKETKLNIIAANFWKAGKHKVDILSANNPAAIMIKFEPEGVLTVSASDPTQIGSIVEIEIDKIGNSLISKSPEIKLIQLNPTIKFSVNVKDKKGETLNLVIKLKS